jgi:hypothetical protein
MLAGFFEGGRVQDPRFLAQKEQTQQENLGHYRPGSLGFGNLLSKSHQLAR